MVFHPNASIIIRDFHLQCTNFLSLSDKESKIMSTVIPFHNPGKYEEITAMSFLTRLPCTFDSWRSLNWLNKKSLTSDTEWASFNSLFWNTNDSIFLLFLSILVIFWQNIGKAFMMFWNKVSYMVKISTFFIIMTLIFSMSQKSHNFGA